MALVLRAGATRALPGPRRVVDAVARAADLLRRGLHHPALAVLVVALAARLYRIDTAYEIHVDEVSYADTATAVADGQGLTMFGVPFHLHPPGYFVLLAVVEKVLAPFGLSEADRFAQVLHLRPAGAVLGALTCALVTVLVDRLAGRVPAVLAGLVLALDPFANRWDSRVFLEAPATLFSVTAISCLVALVQQERPRGRLVVGTGLAVAACTLCKEPYAFLAALPPLVLLVTGRLARRRDTGTVLAITVVANVGLLGALAAAGEFGDWWTEQSSGFLRLVGQDQSTGYNAPGAQSASSSFTEHLATFVPSVVLALLGALSAAVVLLPLLRPLWRTRRLPADPERAGRAVTSLWTACAFAYVGYAFCFGTFEEQNVSMLLAPAATGSGVLLAAVLRPRTRRRTVAAGLAVGLLLGASLTSWAHVHAGEDDSYLRVRDYLAAHVPLDARIAMTEVTGQFLYEGYDISAADTWAELGSEHVDLVLLSTELVSRGYGTASPELLSELQDHGRLVFTSTGQSLGRLELWDVRSVTGGSGRVNDVELTGTS
ncbi:ArnT family glycosyltransferase [Kineococcus rhizosphaerae]|uniref:Dolichyl-phosphate-mannose-protein mannosyltransferase n=1 Tax=Kineococcus rhizosphaerae TaxID=559628 RepID=A0A2T0R4H1_9ACTN|nr:glycosyltransferase family 39 protein [Kineococcus rhizosphaerae]PRY15267.1 dolichyl-phosphate-mannose-protein mannosyltransferase [Kineococcus rhizosphaerae]